MIAFDHPLWPALAPYARVAPGRDNVDLLQLPDDLRAAALSTLVNCVACGAPIHCFRARAKSKRARIGGTETERRLFYAATCVAPAGCSRSRAAKDHKNYVRRLFGLSVGIPSVRKHQSASAEVVAQIDKSIQFAPQPCREAMLAARELLVRT